MGKRATDRKPARIAGLTPRAREADHATAGHDPGSDGASRRPGEADRWVTGPGLVHRAEGRAGLSYADESASGRHGEEDGSELWGRRVSERGVGEWRAGQAGGAALLGRGVGRVRGEGTA